MHRAIDIHENSQKKNIANCAESMAEIKRKLSFIKQNNAATEAKLKRWDGNFEEKLSNFARKRI